MPETPSDFPPLHPGDAVSAAAAKRIVSGLQDRSLPEAEWTRGAHLIAGAALTHELGLAGAEARMPDIIRQYNESTGGQNTDEAGYHHTMTLFYLRVIDSFLGPHRADALHDQATRLLSSPVADRSYPFEYYSKGLLFSVKARRGWVPPDLKSLAP